MTKVDAAPAVNLASIPRTISRGDSVTVDANSSVDHDYSPIASYRTECGSERVVGPVSSPAATSTSPASGKFAIRVTAPDAIGKTGMATATPAGALGMARRGALVPGRIRARRETMTIDEALHRVVRGHWLLILIAVILPTAGAILLGVRQPTLYEAVSRMQVGTSLASSNVQADAASTRALGIATSPGVVESALSAAHVGHGVDPVAFADHHIDVRRIGVSPILEIAVTDGSPERAAAISQAITNAVLNFANAGDRKPETARIEALDKSIVSLTKARDALIGRLSGIAAGSDLRLQAQINALQTTIADDLRQRSELIVSASARSNAVLLDPARTPTTPEPKGIPTGAVLAALMGLVGGLGLAATWETLRPTLRDPKAISLALGAPILGHVMRGDILVPERSDALRLIADRMALLGRRTGSSRALLLPVRAADSAWADEVATGLSLRSDDATAHRLGCAALDGQWREPGQDPAAVVLTPVRLLAREMAPTQELLSSVGWPLLGVVTYDGRRGGRIFRGGVHSKPRLWSVPQVVQPPVPPEKPEAAGSASPGAATVDGKP